MSRSGYQDYADYDDSALSLGRWRGIINSATRGKRGQVFFRELVAALDALPEKRLIKNDLQSDEGVCALGCLGRAKGLDMSDLDVEAMAEDYDFSKLGEAFNIAEQLSQEVMWVNDERNRADTPEQRWQHVRDWAARRICPTEAELEPKVSP
jgi:hypothetical protein